MGRLRLSVKSIVVWSVMYVLCVSSVPSVALASSSFYARLQYEFYYMPKDEGGTYKGGFRDGYHYLSVNSSNLYERIRWLQQNDKVRCMFMPALSRAYSAMRSGGAETGRARLPLLPGAHQPWTHPRVLEELIGWICAAADFRTA